MRTWEARNRWGALVRTFNAADLAEDYRARMAAIGTEITIKRAVTQRRAA